MERRTFQTPLGEVWLLGEPAAWASQGPLVLVLRGAFARAGQYEGLPELIPELPVVFAPSPGTLCPPLATASVGAFAAAYDAALAALGRDVVICGVSLGGLIALGLRSPNVRGVLALDPPLSVEPGSPLARSLARVLTEAPDSAAAAETLWTIFGVGSDRQETRSYHALLEGLRTPTVVLAGDPTAVRDGPHEDGLAGVLSDGDLEAFRAAGVEARRLPGVGHQIAIGGAGEIVAALRRLVAGGPRP